MEYNRRLLLKGNEAAVYGALLAGCDCFFGYPITPASEIAHTAALLFPKLNRTFIQAESEIGAINMVIGAAAAGRRAMTGSSGLGISLKQEGVSYLAAYEMPCLILDITRGGPGLGNIGPEQADYFQLVKGGGHGSYHCLVFTPNSVQEMCDMAFGAFAMAEKYRMPAYVMADGVIGQMMESVELPEPVVMTNGVFDILHRGHVTYLAQARELGKSLIVAVNSDTSVKMLGKGDDRPINTEADRAAVLASLEAVDLVVIFKEKVPLKVIEKAHPDIYVKGGDYRIEDLPEASLVASWGGRTVTVEFEHQRSTTALLKKVRGA